MMTSGNGEPVRVGVVGVSRGMAHAEQASRVGMQVVALCDQHENALRKAGEALQVATYTDYDEFLAHDLDAVILANFFHQHAPFAVKALRGGKHVMSEITACKTLGEAVALVRAVEDSGKIYMLAENYVYFAYVQEMRRLYRAGEIGEMQFGEGEYMSPFAAEVWNRLSPGLDHWRNNMPSTHYCTHALGPIMYVTDTTPVSVNAQSIPNFESDEENMHVRRSDKASVRVCRMDNDSVVSLNGHWLRGHGVWYRVHGTRGLMENLRDLDRQEQLRVVHENWDMRAGDVLEKVYKPEFPMLGDLAQTAGHRGGDLFTNYYFAKSIRENEQPWLDVYKGVAMSMVEIQGWRSCLENGAPVEIPDLRDEANRTRYENDDWSPYPEDRGPGQPPPSIRGDIEPSADKIAAARKIWRETGYETDYGLH